MPTLKDLLRHHREQRGLNQEELAALVEPPLSPDTISNLERGRTRPYRHTLEAVCQALRLDEAARQEVWAAWRSGARPERSAPTISPMTHTGAGADQPTRLIGREAELQRLEQRLLQRQVRLLTLAGPGGVGKTRLALGLMQRLEPRFGDGARFIDLSPLQDADLVVPTIARALGIRDAGGQPVVPLLLDALRARKLLLVLDNFEHVLDAAPELATLLSACPDVTLLATSREPLGLRWEHLEVVPPLDVPRPRDLASLDAVREAPAVALFLERAQAVDDAFALTNANAPAIATVCRRLDGLPLALELAAARVRTLSPGMLLDHLDRQLDLLKGARDAPARQQSLRATLAWSYALLDPSEQALLRRLSIFSGGCRLEAANAVCADTSATVLTGLLALVDKSLLRQQPAGDGAPRYWLLETVRAYALEQLRAHAEQTVAAASHARYFLGLAEAAASHLDGPLQGHWLDRLEEDHDNLRAALRWLVDTGDADAGLRLAVALHAFWSARGHVVEGRTWLDALLALPEMRSSSALRARALNAAGLLASHEHAYAAACSLHQAALELAHETADLPSVATALRRLGDIAGHLNDLRTAESYFLQALSVTRAHGLRKELAQTLQDLGDVAVEQFDFATGQRVLEESLDLFRQMGNPQGIARVAFSLGQAAFGRGDNQSAAAWLEQSLELYSEINDVLWVAAVELYLALALLRCGEQARARALLEDSILICEAHRDDHGVAQALEGLAALAAAQGDAPRALRWCAIAAQIRAQLGLPLPDWDRRWLDAALDAAGVSLSDAQPTDPHAARPLDQVVEDALQYDPREEK